jgi:6-phosphogluconolactonase
MKMKLSIPILFILLALSFFGRNETVTIPFSDKTPILLFVGTYTDNGKSQGIYLYQMDKTTGALSFTGISAKTTDPSYLVIHPNHKWLYAVNELGSSNGKFLGEVSAFRIDLDKKQLVFLNTVSSHGSYPCHISVDHSGKFVMTANYGNGTVAVFPIQKDGSLAEASFVDQHQGKGPNAKRQEGPHAHMIMQGFDNRFVYSNDLGIDKILIYNIDTIHGKLTSAGEVSTLPGAGPRHLIFHQNRKWAYVVNELKGTVEAFDVNKQTGALNRFQSISTLPEGETREPGAAAIHITPNGKFLYATNRAEINNIAMFAIDQESGRLRLLGHQSVKGKTPRNFVIDPSGTFVLVANQNSDNVVTFRIDPVTGLLKDTGIETAIPSPVCLKFLE